MTAGTAAMLPDREVNRFGGVPYRFIIDRATAMYGPRNAVVCGPVARTYHALQDRSNRLGNHLLEQGIRPGDRVAVLLPNCPEYPEIDVGLAQVGFVRVSLNARAAPSQHADIIQDSGAAALIHSDNFDDVAGTLRESDQIRTVLRLGADGDPASDYEMCLMRASGTRPRYSPAVGDLYCLFYTSGTTGRPKGVMLSHGAYVSVALQLLLEFGPVRPGDAVVLTQPLSHGGGFFLLPWFMSGGTCIVMEKYDPEQCLDVVAVHSATTLKVVPTMLLQMLGEDVRSPALPSLARIIYGASPMPTDALKELIGRFGGVFSQLYGQAEAPMCISILTEDDHALGGRLLSSAGRPWRGVEVRVVNREGREVQPGEPGEVIVRGPHLMDGYWHQRDETARVLKNGFVYTRDMAEVDERGYLYLLGRQDEMIISGGFNVAPRHVEDVLNRHPGVLESAVLGIPHQTLGEEVVAFVAAQSGASLKEHDLISYAREHLGFERPRRIRVVPRLPRNPYGKVATAELRASMAEEGGDRG